METTQQIKYIFNRYLENRCTPYEVELLVKHFHTDNKELLHQLVAEELERPEKEEDNDRKLQPLLDDVYGRMQARIRNEKRGGNRFVWPRIAAAAAILIMLSVSTYFMVFKQTARVIVQQPVNKITPGSDKAILTLANGQKIVLSDVKSGNLAQQGGTKINKTADGAIVYNASQKANNEASETGDAPLQLTYNTITTPRGGQYQVILPDNSHVWLNAESSIKFPTAFNGQTREVTITGEAYFEVAKNAHMPFIVSANNTKVEVLGTHFNVNAYADESIIKTTLLEGKVKVSKGIATAFLDPGQQSVVAVNSTSIKVSDADIDEAVAWKNGLFVFNNENIESIMRKISRWYNVDISYQGNVNKKEFGGTISRFGNISDVLDMLQLTGSVHFKVNERRITVMP